MARGSISWLCHQARSSAAPVKLTMMEPTDRNGEAVADLPPHRPLLGKFDVMGIGRGATADETGLGGDKSQMIAVALAHRLADDGHRLGASWASRWEAVRSIWLPWVRVASRLAKLSQPCSEGVFERLGIGP